MRALIMTSLKLSSASADANIFDGSGCLDDCLGHQAGYDRTEQNDVDDEDATDTPSQSFTEGCQSYVEGGSGMASPSDDEGDEDDA